MPKAHPKCEILEPSELLTFTKSSSYSSYFFARLCAIVQSICCTIRVCAIILIDYRLLVFTIGPHHKINGERWILNFPPSVKVCL
ncbi:Schizosaccharomyces pombe specific protein [Schizosaccharomyces pombe]|uniref:Uncharacterized protein C1B2.06 n=1 Tax=Schizosaccharomyces pombe (strain 972 / ATCC 24843) TaxID=284812 RepID=YKF6_SCHPO|nr:uncharacterized protein SPAC1B2.06 [Schizosaccharomyces pombe]G2TRL6.1 RecName: Full=Uncharacterized protein C1B2.06 [Schizosaccharomyces pombe 972h-]CCD31321.1 sequence orphan [Schizosaccharomyces pombe]|eukprot:NP_001343111.1 uncharacterized protein SPAC1B2.06 [Schizosaccharomyces pombe]